MLFAASTGEILFYQPLEILLEVAIGVEFSRLVLPLSLLDARSIFSVTFLTRSALLAPFRLRPEAVP